MESPRNKFYHYIIGVADEPSRRAFEVILAETLNKETIKEVLKDIKPEDRKEAQKLFKSVEKHHNPGWWSRRLKSMGLDVKSPLDMTPQEWERLLEVSRDEKNVVEFQVFLPKYLEEKDLSPTMVKLGVATIRDAYFPEIDLLEYDEGKQVLKFKGNKPVAEALIKKFKLPESLMRSKKEMLLDDFLPVSKNIKFQIPVDEFSSLYDIDQLKGAVAEFLSKEGLSEKTAKVSDELNALLFTGLPSTFKLLIYALRLEPQRQEAILRDALDPVKKKYRVG